MNYSTAIFKKIGVPAPYVLVGLLFGALVPYLALPAAAVIVVWSAFTTGEKRAALWKLAAIVAIPAIAVVGFTRVF